LKNCFHLFAWLLPFSCLFGATSRGNGLAGRLQLHILAAIAEFERSRIQERVRAGLARVRSQGKRLGRPRLHVDPAALQAVSALTVREASASLGVSSATLKRLRRGSKTSLATA
jgi:DNA invertase Pin-like site-specific DNA recombinase